MVILTWRGSMGIQQVALVPTVPILVADPSPTPPVGEVLSRCCTIPPNSLERAPMVATAKPSVRDHLFVSYATEDAAFAQWLTLKLSAEGYLVWCDQVKLLGGESYPRDIDFAIKERTFRLLAVITPASLAKENPRKERTTALNLARARKEDFLIPLNLAGVSATDLDWMISDLTYIPFHESWATGLRQLLRKLESLDTPRSRADPHVALSRWAGMNDLLVRKPERLWSNVYRFKELPRAVTRIESVSASPDNLLEDWPRFRENRSVAWVLEVPKDRDLPEDWKISTVDWHSYYPPTRKLDLGYVMKILIRETIEFQWRKRGLEARVDDRKRQHYFFPPGENDELRLSFTSYTGFRSHLKAVGVRTFRVRGDEREQVRYHLSPFLKPALDLFEEPALLFRLHLYLTTLDGEPLSVKVANRRRKGICKRWWNHEWLSRMFAVMATLGPSNGEIDLSANQNSRSLLLDALPMSCSVPVGIDEPALAAKIEDDAEELKDEEENEDDDDREFGDADGYNEDGER